MACGGEHPRRTVLASAALLLLGAGLVAGAAYLLCAAAQWLRRPDLPPGWQIIRPPHDVFALAIQGDRVWAGGKEGLFLVERRTGQLLPLPAGAPAFSYVTDLRVDRAGRVWIAHLEGLTCFADGERRAPSPAGEERRAPPPVGDAPAGEDARGSHENRWTTWSLAAGVLPGRPLSLLETRDGELWVGTEHGVVCYDGREFRPLAIPEGLGVSAVDVLYQDRDGGVWLGCASPTAGGLYRFAGGEWRAFSVSDGLAHPSVNGILQVKDGSLWIAAGFANRGGASRFADGRWSSVTQADGLAGPKVRSVFEDRAGRLWFGSEYDGVAVREGSAGFQPAEKGRYRVFTTREGLAGREVKAMGQDAEGVYWLGTDDGLSRIEGLPPDDTAREQAE